VIVEAKMAKRTQPDAEALLRKNQHINRKAFAEMQRAVAEAMKLAGPKPQGRELVAPYGGKRLVVDDVSKPRMRSHAFAGGQISK
jgi:hypothetical protein